MKQFSRLVLLTTLVTYSYSAPQFITFKEGKLGVNFGGYHAGVGLGGLLGGGTAGGLFAEAGTPYGQAARAGLGGVVDAGGQTSGGLYAGATAGGNVKASTGLAGGVSAAKTAGTGFASASAGEHAAHSGLGGETSAAGSTGFTFSGSKSFGLTSGVVKEKEVVVAPVEVKPVEIIPVTKKVHAEFDFETAGKAQSDLESRFAADTDVKVKTETKVQPKVVVKEVYVEQPPVVVEKHYYHKKPLRHHLRKTAYLGGYIGAGAEVAPPVPVYKTSNVIEKRIGVESESAADAQVRIAADSHSSGSGAGEITYNKEVTIQRNPTFFSDIFNIPISTLQAVGNFLGNTAGSTGVSVQKSASVRAADGSISPNHASSLSDTQISVQTPKASKFIDDVFAIPINTLSAVNKFLENNVPARKKVQVTGSDGEPTRVRLGPHARRRANKHVIVQQEGGDKVDNNNE